ncbi:MAG TPA: hypothetical protein PK748_09415 [Acidimicrobiales bacterium]|nr:hypothetical protein [Acidimicrobiales bacterium]
MPNVLVALLVLVPAFATGLGLTWLSGLRLGPEERLAVAAPLGALVLGLWGWVLGWLFGFHLTSLSLALLAAVGTSLPGWRRAGGAPGLRAEAADLWRRVRLPVRDPASLVPLVVLLAVAWPITVRILSLAWVTTADGGLAAGHLSTWSDGSAHLAYAGRFSGGGVVPIDSPIAAGEPARYHLLADFFAAQVGLLGVALPSALAITSGFLALAVPAVLYGCGVRLVGGRAAAVLGTVLFCGAGGMGVVHLARDVGDLGWSALVHLPREYSRDPASGLWMDNPTLSYLYAQRNGLLGLPLGLVALTLVWETCRGRARSLVPAGVLVGLLPLANGFAYLVVVAVVAVWAVLYDRSQPWWRFFGPALALGAPVAWWLQPAESSVRVLVGWMAPDGLGPWVWFWLRNLGPFLPLLVLATVWRGTVRTGFARWFAPFWLLWIVPNLVAFHPWEWNNTKYFAFWLLVGSFLVAAVLVRLARTGAPGAVAAALLAVVLTGTGVADLYRATDRSVTLIPWATADGLATAGWARRSLPADAVIATAPTNVNPVTALSGRRAVSGFPGWTFDIGVPDWSQRVDDTRAILLGGPAALEAIERRSVDYVVVGPLERAPEVGVDEAWWAANGRFVFRSGDWVVYAVPD